MDMQLSQVLETTSLALALILLAYILVKVRAHLKADIFPPPSLKK